MNLDLPIDEEKDATTNYAYRSRDSNASSAASRENIHEVSP
jgi:hypothetical protein